MMELSACTEPQDMGDTARKVREDLEILTAIMIYAIHRNMGAFRFSGLRIPRIVQTWECGMDVPPTESFATEVAIFQEHLHERIALLANNQKMIRKTWRLNEKTRAFREQELCRADDARVALDMMAELVNALFSRNEEAALRIFQSWEHRRVRLLNTLDAHGAHFKEKKPIAANGHRDLAI